MPELPEVETIRRQLAGTLVGSRLMGVEQVFAPSLIERGRSAKEALGGRIEAVWRRGKLLGIDLDNDVSLLIHLRMTGQLILVTAGDEYEASRSLRLRFLFDNADALDFNDQRKFGYVVIVDSSEVGNDPFLARLGPDAIEEQFDDAVLTGALARHPRLCVKALLLDQRVVAGLGNIYVDETLWLARVHPARLGESITADEVRGIVSGAKQVLAESVALGGSTLRDYRDANGNRGGYLQNARVFGRQGLACLRCQTPVEKIRVAGRGTHLCPHCQPLGVVGA